MLFIEDINNITEKSDSYKYIKRTMNNLEKALEVQYVKKRALTQILDRIANMKVENVNLTDTKDLLSIIENIKEVLDRIRDNIESNQKLLNEIRDIISRIDNLIASKEKDPRLEADINYFYMLYIEKQNIIEESNIKYEKLLLNTYEYIFYNISNTEKDQNQENPKIENLEQKIEDIEIDAKGENVQENIENSKEENKIEIVQEHKEEMQKEIEVDIVKEDFEENKEEIEHGVAEEKIEKVIEEENITESQEQSDAETEKEEKTNQEEIEKQNLNKEITDNDTLTISEMQNKVFLPYKVRELEKILKENPEKYDSVQDVIDKLYVVSLDRYKNSTFSRFKEAYHLMREKEKASFSEALDLALEVTFKYNLNPAIITACKNLDELDVYLDCLEGNELDDFKIFNIKYDIAPMKR